LSGLPPHQLNIKCGQYLMLLRNLNLVKGVCNGSHLRLLQVSPFVLLCEIVERRHCGQEVLIPRITHRVGIYLQNEVFSHGQLYVALSYGRHLANIKVANDNSKCCVKDKKIWFTMRCLLDICHVDSYKYQHLDKVDGKVKSLFQTLHI